MTKSDNYFSEDLLTDIIVELENIADRLDELVLESVRTAILEGQTKRSDMDKKLTKCRSQILKAIAILNSSGEESSL